MSKNINLIPFHNTSLFLVKIEVIILLVIVTSIQHIAQNILTQKNYQKHMQQ